MKKRTKIITISVFVLVAVFFFLPLTVTTRHQFFDINNGWARVKWESLGVTYRDRVEETAYSILLKDLGFEELQPEWKQSGSKHIGLLSTGYSCFQYGKVAADAKMFVMWLELQEKISPQDKREHVNKFRTLVREGTPEEVREYVESLPYDQE